MRDTTMQTNEQESVINQARSYERILHEMRRLLIDGGITPENAYLMRNVFDQLGKDIGELGQQIHKAYAGNN